MFLYMCMMKNVSLTVLYSWSSPEQDDWMYLYVVYDYVFGWVMVYIKNVKGNIVGCVIVYKDNKIFV